jgi:hypothetical protein
MPLEMVATVEPLLMEAREVDRLQLEPTVMADKAVTVVPVTRASWGRMARQGVKAAMAVAPWPVSLATAVMEG